MERTKNTKNMKKAASKYRPGYFLTHDADFEWLKNDRIKTPPIWCSVDLRDGNQSLITPMNIDEKVEFFKLLCEIGFKEIEVGFPAASKTEFTFLRRLIDENIIPSDVTVQVLTQARPHIIKTTFEALNGAKNAIVHLYNSTSLAQRNQVFRKSKDDIMEIAVSGAKLLKAQAEEYDLQYTFEYSPESFTGTEPEYALSVCDAVLDVWEPTPSHKAIINLPATVEMSMPHVYASQIEYMKRNLARTDSVIISLHPHNDRGCAVADAELGLLAGAHRVEGTLFGNGERTGNVDIVTLALNLYSHGVDPELDFSNMPKITEVYERVTKMSVYERSPYSGKLVFAAFSGSHQDAIAKGMKHREESGQELWSVPYLPIDPTDLGRVYESDVIRINSQSGKGGIGYVLEQNYGYELPVAMKEEFGYIVKEVSDNSQKELSSEDIFDIFKHSYVNLSDSVGLVDYRFSPNGKIKVSLMVDVKGAGTKEIEAHGRGRLESVSNALNSLVEFKHHILNYKEHALERGATSLAAAYVCTENEAGEIFWGVGVDEDIMAASILGLFSAVNRMKRSALDKKDK